MLEAGHYNRYSLGKILRDLNGLVITAIPANMRSSVDYRTDGEEIRLVNFCRKKIIGSIVWLFEGALLKHE